MMIERVCPACGVGNTGDEVRCTACDAQLEQPLARQMNTSLAIRLPHIPPRWQPAAKAIALGATALAIEVGSALLQQWGKGQGEPSTSLARRDEKGLKLRAVRRRVWRTYRNGEVTYETHEETQWFGEP